MKNKKKVVVVIGIAAILLVSIIGYLMYRKERQNRRLLRSSLIKFMQLGRIFQRRKAEKNSLIY